MSTVHVLMVGVDESTKGGMWTVAKNYLDSEQFADSTHLKYISTSITGSITGRVLFTAKALLKIIKELKTGRYDIAHIHMAERGSVYRKNIVVDLARKYGCKVVLHLHGAEFESWYKGSSNRNKSFVRSVLNKADGIIILGNYWKEFIGSLIDDQEKLHVIYNAVRVPDKNPYNSSADCMLFLGVVGQRKGIDDLLQAVKLADSDLYPSVKLLIYGPDDGYGIGTKINEYELEHRAEYCGWLSQENRKDVFDRIALNILPSYNEGLPMTILETMAYGIPNITTNIAAIPEAVDNENGKIIGPGDIKALSSAIVELIADREKLMKKSELSYLTAKTKFSLEEHFNRVINLYNELV